MLKVDSPDVSHRSDVGAVRVGLNDAEAVRQAFDEVVAATRTAAPDARIAGVLVQSQVSGVAEVFVGVSQDPQVGPVLLWGLGGVFVEVLQDVAMRPVPLGAADFEEMLAELRGRPLLFGARGRPAADVDAVRRAVLGVSALAADLGPLLAELDLNPLIVLPNGQGARVVDALVVRSETPARPRSCRNEGDGR